MSAEYVEARSGAYADSVTLMQVSAAARKADGVEAALVAMATELNLGLLPGMGFGAPPQAGPNDLLIARAGARRRRAGRRAGRGRNCAHRPAGRRRAPDTTSIRPRTTGRGDPRQAGPGLALVSVPGRFAFAEAMDALQRRL